MNFDEYQKKSSVTDTYVGKGDGVQYAILGLLGESGEVADKLKKIMREEEGKISEERKEELKQELGDILWYMAKLARELGLSLSEVAVENLRKVRSRKARGKIFGSGDNR